MRVATWRLHFKPDANPMSESMSCPKHPSDAPNDTTARAHDDGWTVTPRALTTIATIITILYSLNAPVRYILAVASSVEILERRVAALETIVARDAQRQPVVVRPESGRGRGTTGQR